MRAQAAVGKPFFATSRPPRRTGRSSVPQKYRDALQGPEAESRQLLRHDRQHRREHGASSTCSCGNRPRDNTILIFMTDNGGTVGVPVFNAGMRGKKIHLYDGGHRVPCFIRWPAGKLRPPGDVAELTEVQDILPTLVDLCRLRKPRHVQFDGLSLAGLLRGECEQLPDRMLVVQFSRMQSPAPQKGDAAVLWQRWRLVQDKELVQISPRTSGKATTSSPSGLTLPPECAPTTRRGGRKSRRGSMSAARSPSRAQGRKPKRTLTGGLGGPVPRPGRAGTHGCAAKWRLEPPCRPLRHLQH